MWNGSTCANTWDPNIKCGEISGYPITCTCAQTGTGWNPYSFPEFDFDCKEVRGSPLSLRSSLFGTTDNQMLCASSRQVLLRASSPSLKCAMQGRCQDVYGNNGLVSCTGYCAGISGGPWNNELPSWWNGAYCDSTAEDTMLENLCDRVIGLPVVCTCIQNNEGWNPRPFAIDQRPCDTVSDFHSERFCLQQQ